MRILPVVLGAALLATPVFAQQREVTAQVHCRSDNAAAAAIEAWAVDNEIVVYSVQNGSLALEWSYKAQEYEMWDYVSWDGDDRIKLEVTLWTVDGGGNRALMKQSAELRRTSWGWVLNKNVPSGRD